MTTDITLFGCGAIGSQLAVHLASPDIQFVLVDDDRVGEDNLPTSAYLSAQVGVEKSYALANFLYRKCGCNAKAFRETLTTTNYGRSVRDSILALDCFDNAETRLITCKHAVPTLHVGVSRDGTGSITWDEHYKPFDGAPRGQDTFCTHLAGRGIIRLTACIAANVAEVYLATGRKQSLLVTERMDIFK